MKNLFTIIILSLCIGFSNSKAQGDETNATPFVIFDGLFVSGNLSSFTWGQSAFDVEWLTGATSNTNSLKWIQGDEWGNGWTGAGFNIGPAVDLSVAWTEDDIKFKMKAEPGTDSIRIQFESGADGKVGYEFQPIGDNTWHDYSIPLNSFWPVDGTTNFNPGAVTVFQVMALANSVAGRILYLDDLWTGNPTINLTMPPIMVDGDVSDAAYENLASWDGADNWGSNNDLGDFKFFTDGNQLYIGLSGKIEENWNKMAIFMDFDGYNGIPAGTPIPGGGVPGFFQTGGIGGSILNMELDFAFSVTTDPGNPLWCDAAHYDATTVVAADGIGNSNKNGNPSTLLSASLSSILGGTSFFGVQAYRNTFDRTTNTTHGLELCFDISAFQGVTNLQQVRFFVAIINSDGSWWSNEFLPDYYNSTGGSGGPFAGDFGTDPDLNTVAITASVDLFTSFSALPVELISFTAQVSPTSVLLNWATSTEINNSGFNIERSVDGVNFNKIGFVPGIGTTSEMNSYSFTDNNISDGTFYYRLNQIDFDGSSTLSEIIEVEIISPVSFELNQNYPNPFNPSTKISFSIPQSGVVILTVYNILGEKVLDLIDGFMNSGYHEVTFEASGLNSGMYLYELKSGNLRSTKKMLLLQ